MNLPEAEREMVMRRFFTSEGAGMSIVRIRLVPEDGWEFDPQVRFCLRAKELGATRFYATVWEVPGKFLDANAKLLPARFEEYAEYIAGFVRLMGDRGVPVGWIGVQNEPDNGPKLEGSWTVEYNKYTVHYYRSKAELRDFSVALKRVLAEGGQGHVKLLGPECMGWEGTREMIQAQFETAEGRAALDIVATHDYWGAERDADMNPVRAQVAALAGTHGKRIWQTEYSRFDCLPGCSDACHQTHVAQDPARLMTEAAFNMQEGLDMAQYVYRDIALARASAWLYWWTHNPNKGCGDAAQGQAGMHNSFNGLALIRPDSTFFFPKRFHVLSHYMRFIRPGDVRIALSTDGEDALRPLAFRDSAGGKVTVVLYNRGTTAALLTLSLPGFPALTSVKRWTTAESADQNVLGHPEADFPADSGHAFELPPRSVATLVFGRPAPTAIGRGAPIREMAGADRSSLQYEAAAGETVILEARDLRGNLLFRDRRIHSGAGRHRFTWPGADKAPWVAAVTYAGVGEPFTRLILP
jgi:O-glycosyl hydrolase